MLQLSSCFLPLRRPEDDPDGGGCGCEMTAGLLQNDNHGVWIARTVVESFLRLNQEWRVRGKRRLGGTGKRGVDARIFF